MNFLYSLDFWSVRLFLTLAMYHSPGFQMARSMEMERSSKSRSGKPRIIRAWPMVTGILPLLAAYDGSLSKYKVVSIDFSGVSQVDAVGLAIFLARLVRLRSESEKAEYEIVLPSDPVAIRQLEDLEFRGLCSMLGIIRESSKGLWDYLPVQGDENVPSVDIEMGGVFLVGKIIPIIIDETLERESFLEDVCFTIKQFVKQDKSRTFNHEQVVTIIREMIKNTIDHSDQSSVLGLQMKMNGDRCIRFEFCYCDTGIGICEHIRQKFKSMHDEAAFSGSKEIFKKFKDPNLYRLGTNGAFSDILHWALQPGHSTSNGDGTNQGLGLMVIVKGARNCDMRLSLKDAGSVLNLFELDDNSSHSTIRKMLVPTCAPPMTMIFFGELDGQNG